MPDNPALDMMAAGEDDMTTLAAMLDPTIFPERSFGLHAQQAVEKFLKVWLLCKAGSYPFKHDLGLLFGLLQEAGENIENYIHFVELTDYASRFRYGPQSFVKSPLARGFLLDQVKELHSEVDAILAQAVADGLFD